METYKKPIMKIVELEKVDVLTSSCTCIDKNHACNCGKNGCDCALD